MTDVEMSLGDTVPADDGLSRDVTDPAALTPEGFNLEAWIAGARPQRRATTIYGRPDLLADLDVLAERLTVARAAEDTAGAARLVADMRQIREQLAQSALDVVVEASSEHTRRMLRESLGITDGAEVTEEQTIGFIAAHIVAPAGMDAAMVARLAEVTPQQVAKIAAAVRTCNESAPSVPAPFSPASSTAPRRRG
ncbi:hypothetical protein [Actinomyces procaprae]|uniref:hypothetical protein n=1 Tax=Actinomyces procaprae TaxID=2560010 RepID=UPI0010A1FC17|nr:hypothetical protein [Actinomyces procaprae]